jgi:hypothetical protein
MGKNNSIVDKLLHRALYGRNLNVQVHQHFGYKLHFCWNTNHGPCIERGYLHLDEMTSDTGRWVKYGLCGMATCMYELCYRTNEVYKCQYKCKEFEKPYKHNLLNSVMEELFYERRTCDCLGDFTDENPMYSLRVTRKEKYVLSLNT